MRHEEAPGARTPGAAEDQRDTRRGTRTSRVQATQPGARRAAPGTGEPCSYCGARPQPPSRAARRKAIREGIKAPLLGVYLHAPGCLAVRLHGLGGAR
jgi:hypothetical protein